VLWCCSTAPRHRGMMKTEAQKQAHAAYMRDWRAQNPDKVRAINQKSYYGNHEARKARLRADRAKNVEKARSEAMGRHHKRMASDSDYRRRFLQATRYHRVLYGHPHFRDGLAKAHADETRAFYNACPVGMQVDHIWPLRHKLCCGLHVPWNLQYLSLSDNRSKGRKLPHEWEPV
jgi:hypothetical protein